MKKIVLGVTGSIAAYKALEIVRLFKKKGEDIFCVLTREATKFVSPLSFYTLSGNEVIFDFFELKRTPVHVELATLDAILVAPATYNLIGKVASGIADDALSCIIADTRSPVIFAPCMDTGMWENSILQDNIKKLKSLGYHFIEPVIGELSTLQIGKGRFPTPEFIVEETYRILYSSNELNGKKILVTAGRTEEDIDPVRCITNRSSGIMGYALAYEARRRGGDVTLISGPSSRDTPWRVPTSGVKLVNVRTTNELELEVLSRASASDILIMAAAVADYTPVQQFDKKVKNEYMDIKLKRTHDILKLVRKKNKGLFIIGFSLETDEHIKWAKTKLRDKALNLIVSNDVASIGSNEARVSLINCNLKIKKLPLLPKSEVAKKIIDYVVASI
ncbi:MAG: bifunctional phosphopantothenoylcysteine decarboxylase/phosphopantothenate--cysteine ligase CoaBC [bacterium]|nr:bifunctional phosphopantothenoylcysteine decarboxylase/phosphopantothenate--cysteine ligase CoaBC [bacterium]